VILLKTKEKIINKQKINRKINKRLKIIYINGVKNGV